MASAAGSTSSIAREGSTAWPEIRSSGRIRVFSLVKLAQWNIQLAAGLSPGDLSQPTVVVTATAGVVNDLDRLLALFGFKWAGSAWRRTSQGRHRPPSDNTLKQVERETFTFHKLELNPDGLPFPKERMKLLKQLANDPAIRSVMAEHRYLVGTL